VIAPSVADTYDCPVDLEVDIDRDVCMGSGNCTYEAPDVFALDDDGVSSVVRAVDETEEKVIVAARKCPARAISVRRAGVDLV
jgi:ferredoxin